MIQFVTDLDNYAEESFEFLQKLIKLSSEQVVMNQTMIDVGANRGDTTKMMIGHADQVIAIDAHPDWLNHFELLDHPSIITHNVACYSKNVQKKFIAKNQLNGHGFIGLSPVAERLDIKNLQKFVVDCVTLDALIQVKKDNCISFIKIDAESSDFEIILGAEQLIAEHRPWMYFEFSGQIFEKAHGHTRRDFFDFFTRHNYTLRSVGLGLTEEEILKRWDSRTVGLADLIAIPTECVNVLYN
jgi:FkbM family methyltransferase